MATLEGASLGALLSAWGDGDAQAFRPVARYYESMDWVIYLQEDVAYRADRVDGFLTLLWHPDESRLIGVKIKGFRWLFKRFQAMSKGETQPLPDAAFVPLMKAIELALTARLGEILNKALETEVAEEQAELAAERQSVEERYQQAKEIVDSMTVDASELLAAA